MTITAERKAELIKEYATQPNDTGSPEVQVAVLSERFGAYVTGTTIVVDGGIALKNWIEPPHV